MSEPTFTLLQILKPILSPSILNPPLALCIANFSIFQNKRQLIAWTVLLFKLKTTLKNKNEKLWPAANPNTGTAQGPLTALFTVQPVSETMAHTKSRWMSVKEAAGNRPRSQKTIKEVETLRTGWEFAPSYYH